MFVQEMPLRRYPNHQSAEESGIADNTSLWAELVQATPTAHAARRRNSWTGACERAHSPRVYMPQVGTNGIGKSTALKILSGKLKPNLGRFKNPPDWNEITNYFRGSELQNYLAKIVEDNLKAVIKPQYVDQIPKAVNGTVQAMIDRKDERKCQRTVCDDLGACSCAARTHAHAAHRFDGRHEP
jgi:hypothetical protein